MRWCMLRPVAAINVRNSAPALSTTMHRRNVSGSAVSAATQPPPTPEPTVGYDLALDRAAKILLNVTDRAMTLVLHAYCGTRFVEFLGSNTNFDVVGCSDAPANVDVAKSAKQYSKSELVSYSQPLPFRAKSFQFVVCLQPPDTPASQALLCPTEIVRILSDNGYALIGAEKSAWERENVFPQLEGMDKRGEISFLSLQMLPLENGGTYCLALAKVL